MGEDAIAKIYGGEALRQTIENPPRILRTIFEMGLQLLSVGETPTFNTVRGGKHHKDNTITFEISLEKSKEYL